MFSAVRSVATRWATRWAIRSTLLLLCACGRADEAPYRPSVGPRRTPERAEYVVGIHPLHNPQRLLELYGPIVDRMNAGVPQGSFRLEASRNYEEFERKLFAGHFAFAMPNPYQTVRALDHGYRVFAKMGDDAEFRGIILVRRDAAIREVSDLRGQAVSYPAATALAATMMPQAFLHASGLDVLHDIETRYVGSQESSIVSVLRGTVAAGATWPAPWRLFSAEHPDQARELVVKWETAPLVNNGWVARSDLPAKVVEGFVRELLALGESEAGRRILERLPLSRFEVASDETYRPVRAFLEAFSKNVRPIEL